MVMRKLREIRGKMEGRMVNGREERVYIVLQAARETPYLKQGR
jgi:hypothetical protein